MPPEVDLSIRLTPTCTLSSPVLIASGSLGFADTIEGAVDLEGAGAFITPTLTLLSRQGNPMPRTVEVSAGLIHANGLPNPGLSAFVQEDLPRLLSLPCPLIVSIHGESREAWQALAGRLSAIQGIVGLELNLTPTSLHSDGFRYGDVPNEAEALQYIAESLKSVRAVTSLPLIAKLPNIGAEIGAASRAAVEGGADVIAVSQAFPAVAIRLGGSQFRLPGVVGGLSGPAVKPLSLYQVWRVAQSVSVPIIGTGGVMCGEDALEFLMAGATAVGVGTANFIHPNASSQILLEIRAWMERSGVREVAALAGLANKKG